MIIRLQIISTPEKMKCWGINYNHSAWPHFMAHRKTENGPAAVFADGYREDWYYGNYWKFVGLSGGAQEFNKPQGAC